MNTTNRWVVRPSGFPFNSPGQPIGSVVADERREAEQLAQQVFGRQVVVEPERETDSAAFEAEALQSRAMRIMTPIEIQMARAVGVVKYSGQHKGTIKRLHAETFKKSPEISEELAKKLRAIVHALRAQLPPELIESVGGGA